MKFAYFPGCKIPHHLPEYGESVEAVCKALDIHLKKIEFNCCGWPVRHENELASVFSAARNFALAAKAGLPIMTPCKCCFGNLKYAQARLGEDSELSMQVQGLLEKEGLSLPDSIEILHFLTCLDRYVGVEKIHEKVVNPLTDIKVACHYGCHALRPANVTGFDDPLSPTVFERCIEALGAEVLDWELRLECCGHPLRGRDDTISDLLMRKKFENAAAVQADMIATGCTYCQLQFVGERKRLEGLIDIGPLPKSVLVSELIARALNLPVKSD
ncbi:MAG: CoB--CoM heterodisulfide reductase iron-sulfur subunit B family protein [Desulfovibrio sp.]